MPGAARWTRSSARSSTAMRRCSIGFTRYEKEAVSLRVARLEGRLALAAFAGAAAKPSYFILLTWVGDHVQSIRDYRYVPYIAAEADFEF